MRKFRASGSWRPRAIALAIALRRGLYLAVPVALAVLLSGHAHTAGAAPAAGTAGAAGASPPIGASPEAAKPQKLTAGEIIERNVAARGGLAAWHGVRTLATSGHMDIGGRDSIEVPFRLEMKRPRKLRFQLEFQGKRAVQIYDGAHGWKARQYLGRDDTEPYSPQEQQQAADEQELDGPLVDYKSKGTTVALEGTEEVEGHAAYKLKLTLKNGSVRRDWIDARSFLELKLEGQPRRLDGRMHDVEVYYRDYRPVAGLMIPYVLETAVQGVRPGVKATHKMTIEKVEVNPKIDDSVFTRPQALTAASAGSR